MHFARQVILNKSIAGMKVSANKCQRKLRFKI
jgi:hypothetical protein